MKFYYIMLIILLSWLSARNCMSQKLEYYLNGEKNYISIYLKNNTPMIPIEAVGFTLQYKISGKGVIINNYIYTLKEKPEVINNQLFVPADYFPKVMNECLSIDSVHSKMEIFSCELTNECVLFIKKGTSFSIQLDEIWEPIINPEDSIILIKQEPIILINHRQHVWGTRPNLKTGEIEPFSEDRQSISVEKKRFFEANKVGDFVIIFKNTNGDTKKYKIITTD